MIIDLCATRKSIDTEAEQLHHTAAHKTRGSLRTCSPTYLLHNAAGLVASMCNKSGKI